MWKILSFSTNFHLKKYIQVKKITVKIKYITSYNQKKDFVVFGFTRV